MNFLKINPLYVEIVELFCFQTKIYNNSEWSKLFPNELFPTTLHTIFNCVYSSCSCVYEFAILYDQILSWPANKYPIVLKKITFMLIHCPPSSRPMGILEFLEFSTQNNTSKQVKQHFQRIQIPRLCVCNQHTTAVDKVRRYIRLSQFDIKSRVFSVED